MPLDNHSALLLEPYEKARNLYLDWCSDIKGATPIEFGSVRSPGLSDLDLGIVFSNDTDITELSGVLSKKMKSFPSLVKETMNGGTLMLFPENSFYNILYADDVNIKAFDSRLRMASISESEEQFVCMAQVIEWLPERIAKIFLELKSSQKNTKRLIGFYYSLCYSLLKVTRFCGEFARINEFIDNVYSLRDTWHHLDSHDRNQKLEWLEKNYIFVSKIAITIFSERGNNFFNLSSSLLNKKHKYNLYSNVFLVASTTDKFNDIVRYENGMINLYLPPIFLANYFIYASHNSKLGELMRNRSYIINEEKSLYNECVSLKMLNILNIRIEMFSDFYSFVDELSLGSGLYKFGWYLNDKKTV